MRMVTNTNTGKIVSDIDLCLEYLYVGDYGKENNIKADFLGYTKRIDKVKHKPVNITDKLVVTVSSQKGCPMNCNFCDCPKLVPTNKLGIKEECTNGHDCTVVDNTNVNKKIMIMKKHITVRVPVCSVCGWCGYDEYNATNYCPNCGAKCVGEKE